MDRDAIDLAALWFVSAQAWGILDWNSRGAERAAEAKLGLSIAAINWPAQCFKVGAPIIRDLPNPLAGEGYIASLEYAAFDIAPFEICRTEDCKVTRDFG